MQATGVCVCAPQGFAQKIRWGLLVLSCKAARACIGPEREENKPAAPLRIGVMRQSVWHGAELIHPWSGTTAALPWQEN